MPKMARELYAVDLKRLTKPGRHLVGVVPGLALQVAETGARSWVHNSFNSGSGWSGLGAEANRHQLVVDGNAGDALRLGSGWNTTSTASPGGQTYAIWNHASSAAQVLVATGVTVLPDAAELRAF